MQSDICHQSVYELVHSEDREELMQQLKWDSMLPKHTMLAAPASAGANNNTATAAAADNASSATDDATAAANRQTTPKCAGQMGLHELLNSGEHRFLIGRSRARSL